ncbi:Pseudouridine kinase [Clostridiaceae bacterium JG1575]|nr:Pseudouridine kinase [Clostridiaceae bacterium JG1575]
MTKREKQIVEILRKEPMICQQDLADRLGVSRSSVAVHITNMMKKGIIAGKGYVIREDNYIAVVGGANMDIFGMPDHAFQREDSNPGRVVQSPGGVGRNVAENLARLCVPVRLFTLLGEDVNGDVLMARTQEAGVDTSYIQRERLHPTGVYLAVQDEKGEMRSAISQMEIYDQMDESYPESVLRVLSGASLMMLDTNLSPEALAFLLYRLPQTRMFLDPVSSVKARRVKHFINRFDTIKPNVHEVEALSGIPVTDDESLVTNAKYFLRRGVKHIFITLGDRGVFVADSSRMGFVQAKPCSIKNANGAGDAFMAAIMMTAMETEDTKLWALNGMAAAILTLSTEHTINRDMNPSRLEEIKKEYEITWKDLQNTSI